MKKFNIPELVNILTKIKNSGYHFAKFPNKKETIKLKGDILLRHDIDFSLTAAKKIAIEEYNLGICSTFFVYLNTPFYNIAFKKDKDIIEEIISLGHDVALHFDDNSDSNVKDEIEILRRMYPKARTDIISLHKPTINKMKKELVHNYPITTTYDVSFFANINYLSDSRCDFDMKALNSVVLSNKSFQLLLHPIWWFYEGDTLEQKFNKLCSLKMNEIHDNIRESISIPIDL
jgi:hypothetical protein